MREFQIQAEPNRKKTQGKVKIAPFLAFTLWNFTCLFPSVRLRSCYVGSRVCLLAFAFVLCVNTRVCLLALEFVMVVRVCSLSFAFLLW